MLPPTSVWNAAPMLPRMLRERTTMPRTTPRFRVTAWPGSSNAVVTIFGSTADMSTSWALRPPLPLRPPGDPDHHAGDVVARALRLLGRGQPLARVRRCRERLGQGLRRQPCAADDDVRRVGRGEEGVLFDQPVGTQEHDVPRAQG